MAAYKLSQNCHYFDRLRTGPEQSEGSGWIIIKDSSRSLSLSRAKDSE
jgi:hypothetical protein